MEPRERFSSLATGYPSEGGLNLFRLTDCTVKTFFYHEREVQIVHTSADRC